MVAADKDVVVLRTFSKVYGMAGIRCGFAVGRPDLLKKLEAYGQNAMPITGSAASECQPARSRARPPAQEDHRRYPQQHLRMAHRKQLQVHPVTVQLLHDRHRPQRRAVIAAMQKKNVFIGRTWPIWPNTVRVTVGSPDDMAKFKVAFKDVMDAPPVTAELISPFESNGLPDLA